MKRISLSILVLLVCGNCATEDGYELEPVASEQCNVLHYELPVGRAEFTLAGNGECAVLNFEDGYLNLWAGGDRYYSPDEFGCVAIVDGDTGTNLSLFVEDSEHLEQEIPIVELDIAGYLGGDKEWKLTDRGPFSCEFYNSLKESLLSK